jgi:hypothetical protein
VTRSRFQYTLKGLGQRAAITETLGLATRTISCGYDGQQRPSRLAMSTLVGDEGRT